MNRFENIVALIVMGAVAWWFFNAMNRHEEQKKVYAAEYAHVRAWKDPLVRNCKNAVRKLSDSATIKFVGYYEDNERIDDTENGYQYYVSASDSSTANTPIVFLCYTDRNGQVVRVVPLGR